MNNDLPERVSRYVTDERLFPEPGLALLAVSGGPDSVALLDLMVRVGPSLGLHLALAHIDHGILPDSPDLAERVMGLAVRYKVRGYMASLKLGHRASETRAREGRYEALWDIYRRTGAAYLVTAHHADDQIETVLFRLLRGTGPAGLAGIAPSRPDGLVRPLLPFRKGELLDWVEGRLPVHADASNLDPAFERSWIRHELLPLLRGRFGHRVDEHLLAAAGHAAADRAAWELVLDRIPDLHFEARTGMAEVDRAPLGEYDKRLSEALLRAVARTAGCVLGPKRAARLRAFAVRAGSGRTFQLGQRWVAEIAFKRLRIFRLSETWRHPGGTRLSWERDDVGEVNWGRWTFSWSRQTAQRIRRDAMTTWIAGDGVCVRSLQPGDRLRPAGGVGRRRVSRLLMEGRIPRSERGRYPVLVRGPDIIWVPGVCRADTANPEPGEPAVRLDASVS